MLLAIGLPGASSVRAAPAAPEVQRDLPILPSQSPMPLGPGQKDTPPPRFEPVRAPDGAPNVLVVLLDDVGFGAAGTFGGPVDTPALERLARAGLRFNQFHTAAICSPTRAALLTGRNPHAVGMGAVMNTSNAYPGYRGYLPKSAATIAEVLRGHGYGTAAFGKWHLMPNWENSPAGPFDRWPTGVGFEKFYGFLGGETDQFEPTLFDGTTPVKRPARTGYHLNEDLADQAIAWIRRQNSLAPGKPFFVYYAPGGTHAPLQAPKAYIDKYRGRFDQGWDRMREETLARQKQLGVIPADAQLTPRPKELPAWDSMSTAGKRIAARLMEAYAGFLDHTDVQVGRVVDAIDELGLGENTLVFYVVGDNGASAEGTPRGAFDYAGTLQGVVEDTDRVLAKLDAIGGPGSYPHYPSAWAWAMDTPFQWTKQVASHLGGIRNPLVVRWPRGIADRGGLRSQFGYVSDVMPTVLEAAGIPAPQRVNGVDQQPIDGTSLLYAFGDAKAPARHRTQYFEVYGNRAIYHDGWIASARRARTPWTMAFTDQTPFEADRWELYDLRGDFSQSRDLAAQEPQRLRAMQDLFMAELARSGGWPLHVTASPEGLPSLVRGRKSFTFYPGAQGIPENSAPPLTSRSYTVTVRLDAARGASGPLVAEGGRSAGWALWIDERRRPGYTYRYFDEAVYTIVDTAPLAPGRREIQLRFDYAGGGPGRAATATLLVDGRSAGSARLERTVPAFFSIDETFGVGIDSGSAVGPYAGGAEFTGRLVDVRVELK